MVYHSLVLALRHISLPRNRCSQLSFHRCRDDITRAGRNSQHLRLGLVSLTVPCPSSVSFGLASSAFVPHFLLVAELELGTILVGFALAAFLAGLVMAVAFLVTLAFM